MLATTTKKDVPENTNTTMEGTVGTGESLWGNPNKDFDFAMSKDNEYTPTEVGLGMALSEGEFSFIFHLQHAWL